jgi:hypothetical protein
MSEPIWCNVNIATPATWVDQADPNDWKPLPGFLAGVLLDHDGLINGEHDCVTVDGRAQWSWSGEGNYGLFDSTVEEALDWCEANRVPYVATSDTKYDMTGEIRIYDGTERADGDYNEGVVLTEHDFNTIHDSSPFDDVRWKKVVDYFKRLNRTVADLPIEHLPATPPEEEP